MLKGVLSPPHYNIFKLNLDTIVLSIIIFIISYSLLQKLQSWLRNHPPGPFQLPIFGNLLHMLPAVLKQSTSKNFLEKTGFSWKYKPAYIIMHEISEKYGKVADLQFGINHAIIVNDAEVAKAVFCRDEFQARFADGWFVERSFKKALGLIFNNGEDYKKMKKFTIKMLRDFGFGKKGSMELSLNEELAHFLTHFSKKVQNSREGVVRMKHSFTLPVLNVLWKLIGGERFSYEDTTLNELIETVEEISRSFDIGGNILMALPFLRYLFPRLTGHERQMELYGKLHHFFRELLRDRMRENRDEPRDFIDVFIEEMSKNGENNGENSSIYTEEQFIMVCLDLFTAGSETTANTLEFGLLYMVLFPKVQKKVHEEIQNVIGLNRLPNSTDRVNMPYTEATLLEIQRFCNVVPLVHRVCTKKTKLANYTIEKDSVMLINLHSIHMCQKTWGDPTEFRPERFLNPEGNINNLIAAQMLPFGMGKRICMGIDLAKQTLFIYFASILQKYTFDVAPSHGKPNLTHGKGFTLSPPPYYALINSKF